MTVINTVKKFSEKAAESYIQTVVFIDDRLYDNTESNKTVNKVNTPQRRKQATNRSKVKTIRADIGEDFEEVIEHTIPHPVDIINTFAKKQIVCSLYKPKKNSKFTIQSDVFQLCKTADVVIVDWDMYEDNGEHSLTLISQLVKQAVEDVPEQIRLILIYTEELNLIDIAERIFDMLSSSDLGINETINKEDQLVFSTQNTRLVVLGKETGRDRGHGIDKNYIVSESKLAMVVIEQFALLASGILQAIALFGLAEIRNNSRKILSKFDRDIDPAFFTHRAMLLPNDDSFSQILPLLVSEIESVLEDNLSANIFSDSLIEDWCDYEWKHGNHLTNYFNQKGIDYFEIAKFVCTKGFKESTKMKPDVTKLKQVGNLDKVKWVREAAKFLIDSPSSDVNSRFAHLMSSRTYYSETTKYLQLGVIINKENSDEYFLCVQPVCDSVRLNSISMFLFLRLQLDNKINEAGNRLVVNTNSGYRELLFYPKASSCVTLQFSPDATSSKVTPIAENDEVYFIDVDEKKYEWVSQLRPSHAQRSIEMFSSDLSRVGLTESEYLRLISKT